MRIPPSTLSTVILPPASSTFITGLAKQYDDTYPELLRPHLLPSQFSEMITELNDELFVYFPCTLCYTLGYVCCLPTLGLSLCCTGHCVREAEHILRDLIEMWNRKLLNSKGLEMRLVKHCGTSWLEIEIQQSLSKVKLLE